MYLGWSLGAVIKYSKNLVVIHMGFIDHTEFRFLNSPCWFIDLIWKKFVALAAEELLSFYFWLRGCATRIWRVRRLAMIKLHAETPIYQRWVPRILVHLAAPPPTRKWLEGALLPTYLGLATYHLGGIIRCTTWGCQGASIQLIFCWTHPRKGKS